MSRKDCEEQLTGTRAINIYVETIYVNIFMGTWDTKDTLMMGNRDTSYSPRG